MQRVAYGLSWVSGVLAIFCAVAYLLTFFGQNLPAALAALAFCPLFFIFVPLVIYGFRHGVKDISNYVAKHHQWILTVLILLALLNFFWNLEQLEGGSAENKNGQYILINRGTLIRELTESEYFAMRVAELRLMSGHSILFSALAAFGWHGVARRLETKAVRAIDP